MITIAGVGPTLSNFPRQPANNNHSSTGRITALALGADGKRMYAGSWAGVWRSDDAGATWAQLTWPQPTLTVQGEVPGALYAPHMLDLAVSPVDSDLVLVSALDSQYADGRDGIYRSTDGGATWTLVMQAPRACHIVFAPDDPQLVYAVTTQTTKVFPVRSFGVVAISNNAGAQWNIKPFALDTSLWHVAVGPLETNGKRRVYAVGDTVVWYSEDGGNSWNTDLGVVRGIKNVRSILSNFQTSCGGDGVSNFGTEIAYAGGDGPQVLAIEPGNPARVYMATLGGALGPTYYSDQVADGTLVNTDCLRLAGEASMWVGDFSRFDANSNNAQWTLLSGPPVYSGETSPSGNCFVSTKPTTNGFLLFFSDNSHVHVCAGTPTDNSSWHRLDGMDASVAHRSDVHENIVFMHVDPHAITFTPDFEITLKQANEPAPYNENSELDQHVAGRLWMANDGGVYFCDDGGQSENSWQASTGLETLDGINVAGLSGIGNEPALYMGCGDNNDFFSRDGGQHWEDPGSGCGDCDAWFTDSAQVSRVVQFLPRRGNKVLKGYFGIISSDGSEYPDASNGDNKKYAPSPKKVSFNDPTKLVAYAASDVYLIGYRPLILTLATEAPLPDGDLIAIEQALDGTAQLFRTTAITSIGAIDDWHDANKATPIGPPLPPGVITAQASGGHAAPAFYAGTRFGGQVFKLNSDQTAWVAIVPNLTLSTPVKNALSWFVDPTNRTPSTCWIKTASRCRRMVAEVGSSMLALPALLLSMRSSRFPHRCCRTCSSCEGNGKHALPSGLLEFFGRKTSESSGFLS